MSFICASLGQEKIWKGICAQVRTSLIFNTTVVKDVFPSPPYYGGGAACICVS